MELNLLIMKSNSVCVTFAISFLFLASFVSSEPEYIISPSYDILENKVNLFDIRSTLVISCNVTVQDSSDKLEMIWLKDGKPIKDFPDLDKRSKTNNDKGLFKMTISKAVEDDAGNYTCKLQNDEDEMLGEGEMIVATKPAVRLVPNTSVVEGEKLSIHCTVLGNPTPSVFWRVGNETYETSADRIKLMDDTEAGIQNAILVIEEVKLSDRNEYGCTARTIYSTSAETTTYVRVKDKLAALWPFLGICAEVFVLCAIILIYEKKRNKTELEESDTDQSPDQKNTPDNGKESDVRHRK